MAHTNSTPNYGLPQFIGDDKPTFLGDMNGAFSDIDTAMKANEVSAQEANAGVATNASAIEGLQTAQSALTTRVEAVETATEGNTGNINTINSLIGNGEPTTTDKTLIGAINELDGDITSVTGRLANKYAFKGIDVVTVTADGTKNYGGVLDDLCAAINTYLESKSSKQIFITRDLTFLTYALHSLTALLSGGSASFPGSGIRFDGVTVTNSTTAITNVSLRTSGSGGYLSTGSGTPLDLNAQTPASGTVFTIRFEIYEKI